MNIDLKGKVAIVTGGSRGIGAAISMAFAAAGATVAVNYLRDEKSAKSFMRKFHQKRYHGFLIPGDVSDYLEADSLVHAVVERVGRIDILVNNAGIWKANPIGNPRADEAWDQTLSTNLKSAFNMSHHSTPFLARSRSGRIINISSTAGVRGEAGHADYAASKGGMIALTKSLAVELAPHDVLVNCVAPGWVWTDMTIPYLRNARHRKAALDEIPLKKFATPEDVAGSVLFLASSLSTHITGAVIHVNGGSVL